MLDDLLIRDDGLRVAADGLELDVWLGWYRSLPLSCVETIDVSLDGVPVPREGMLTRINGRERALDELHGAWDEEWFVLDPLTLIIAGAKVASGAEVEVDARVGNLIPYILLGPTTPLEYFASKRLTIRAA